MYIYEIWVGLQSYKGSKPLTYTTPQKLPSGSVVGVSIRSKNCLGIINRPVTAPKNIAMKPIEMIPAQAIVIPKEKLQLLRWLLHYYPAGSGEVTSLFLPDSLKTVEAVSNESLSIKKYSNDKDPRLTKEQTSSLNIIRNCSGTTILHGDTGSGKTRVYLDLMKEALQKNTSVIFLVPEIGLVPHIYDQVCQQVPEERVFKYHSGITKKNRSLAWHAININNPCVVVGPRSALFTPINNVGLIVIDEFHDGGYKQNNSPRYNVIRVAATLAQLHNSKLVLGSATPPIADMYVAKHKNIPIARMKNLATTNSVSVTSRIIDKRDRSEFTRSQILSTSLINEINRQLKKNRQILLFHNRRGSARIVACHDCGWQAACKNCDLPLTLHEDKFALICHTCGYRTKPPTSCPTCSNSDIIYTSPGTKGIEKEVNKLVPSATIARFDSDNLTNERIDKRLIDIKNGDINIIIGTQVLVKGYDLKNLGLVGIVDADTSLSFPDFSAEERSYQLIRQAIGRVGRGHVNSTVILQTLYPQSIVHQNAINKNWQEFYDAQIQSRKQHNFPPFSHLLKLECTRKSQTSVISATEKLKKNLTDQYKNTVHILGPAPSAKEKNASGYTWQLIIKSNQRSHLTTIIQNLPSGWKFDIDPIHLL